MSKFISKKKKSTPSISTSALPDIIFMLLFFFMVVTVMREENPKVKINQPSASETAKLEKRNLIDYIYVGEPIDRTRGSEPVIQLDDSYAELTDIQEWKKTTIESRPEKEQPLVTTSLKVDCDTKMGIVTDIKQELREANALKINYSVHNGSSLNQ